MVVHKTIKASALNRAADRVERTVHYVLDNDDLSPAPSPELLPRPAPDDATPTPFSSTPAHGGRVSFATARNIVVGGGDPRYAIAEMAAVAAAPHGRGDPLVHTVLSWPGHVQPTTDQLHDVVDQFLEFAQLPGHQVIAAAHDDTDNTHLHLVLNRVCPITERIKQINGGWDRRFGAAFCAHIEARHGWPAEPLASAYMLDGAVVLSDFVSLRERALPSHGHDLGQHVAERLPDLATLSTWQQFHDHLREQDLSCRRSGSGLVFRVEAGGDTRHIAAHKVRRGLGRQLEQRLGSFEPAPEPTRWQRMIEPVRSAIRAPSPPAPTEGARFERISARGSRGASVQIAQLHAALDGAGYHFLYDTKRRGHLTTHVLDRARGDGTALAVHELEALQGNIERCARRYECALRVSGGEARQARLTPESLQRLEHRGFVPNLVAQRGDEVTVAFRDPPELPAQARRARDDALDALASPAPTLPVAGPKTQLHRARAPGLFDYFGALRTRVASLVEQARAGLASLFRFNLARARLHAEIAPLAQARAQLEQSMKGETDERTLGVPHDFHVRRGIQEAGSLANGAAGVDRAAEWRGGEAGWTRRAGQGDDGGGEGAGIRGRAGGRDAGAPGGAPGECAAPVGSGPPRRDRSGRKADDEDRNAPRASDREPGTAELSPLPVPGGALLHGAWSFVARDKGLRLRRAANGSLIISDDAGNDAVISVMGELEERPLDPPDWVDRLIETLALCDLMEEPRPQPGSIVLMHPDGERDVDIDADTEILEVTDFASAARELKSSDLGSVRDITVYAAFDDPADMPADGRAFLETCAKLIDEICKHAPRAELLWVIPEACRPEDPEADTSNQALDAEEPNSDTSDVWTPASEAPDDDNSGPGF